MWNLSSFYNKLVGRGVVVGGRWSRTSARLDILHVWKSAQRLLTWQSALQNFGARGTVSGIRARISTSKAAKRDRDIIETSEDIVDELLADRAEILGIAQSFEEELVAQRISDDDITYVTEQLVPRLATLVDLSGNTGDPDELRKMLDLLLSKETLKILQVLGFNFRDAVGRPLTNLVARLIMAIKPDYSGSEAELRRLSLENQKTMAELSLDPDAYDRFNQLFSR
jgi:hypothetical protein